MEAGWRCERCGLRTRHLECHHRDEDPANNLRTNIEALCAGPEGCHRLAHDTRTPERRAWDRFLATQCGGPPKPPNPAPISETEAV